MDNELFETDSKFSSMILGEEHKGQIIELIESHDKISRVEKAESFNGQFREQLDLYLDPGNIHYQMLGAVDSAGKVVAILGQVFWDREPVWFASIVAAKRMKTNVFDPLNNGTICVMRRALEEGERRNRFRFFILRNRRWPFQRYFDRLHKELPEYSKYARFVETLIPANSKPESWWAWQMMGERMWSADLYVEQLILKQQHRPDSFQIGTGFNSENYNGV